MEKKVLDVNLDTPEGMLAAFAELGPGLCEFVKEELPDEARKETPVALISFAGSALASFALPKELVMKFTREMAGQQMSYVVPPHVDLDVYLAKKVSFALEMLEMQIRHDPWIWSMQTTAAKIMWCLGVFLRELGFGGIWVAHALDRDDAERREWKILKEQRAEKGGDKPKFSALN